MPITSSVSWSAGPTGTPVLPSQGFSGGGTGSTEFDGSNDYINFGFYGQGTSRFSDKLDLWSGPDKLLLTVICFSINFAPNAVANIEAS